MIRTATAPTIDDLIRDGLVAPTPRLDWSDMERDPRRIYDALATADGHKVHRVTVCHWLTSGRITVARPYCGSDARFGARRNNGLVPLSHGKTCGRCR